MYGRHKEAERRERRRGAPPAKRKGIGAIANRRWRPTLHITPCTVGTKRPSDVSGDEGALPRSARGSEQSRIDARGRPLPGGLFGSRAEAEPGPLMFPTPV